MDGYVPHEWRFWGFSVGGQSAAEQAMGISTPPVLRLWISNRDEMVKGKPLKRDVSHPNHRVRVATGISSSSKWHI